ncbi:MAG: hypothetical protein ABEK01_05550 [Candidatus Nanohaloarchaea archaeon]
MTDDFLEEDKEVREEYSETLAELGEGKTGVRGFLARLKQALR